MTTPNEEQPQQGTTQEQPAQMPEQRQAPQQPQPQLQAMPEVAELPEVTELPKYGDLKGKVDPTPRVTVLGRMDSQVALRLGWRQGMVAISVSRFKFLQNELGLDIRDDPEQYLF